MEGSCWALQQSQQMQKQYLVCRSAGPGLFYTDCLSWACILPGLLQKKPWQTACFLLFQVSELQRAGWPQRYANQFLVLALDLRDAAMFSSALQQLMLSSVCAKTCTVAGWDLVWELGVCSSLSHSHPFLLPGKQEKVTAGLASHLHLSITSSHSQPLMWLYTVYSSKWHKEMLIRAFMEPLHVSCVVFLSLCHPSASLMFILKFSICRCAMFHPNLLFSLWPSWVSSPPTASSVAVGSHRWIPMGKKGPKNISPLAQEAAAKQDCQVAGAPKVAM